MQNPINNLARVPKSDARRAAVDLIDAFEFDDETLEPEPEPGDFWGEIDDDCNGISG